MNLSLSKVKELMMKMKTLLALAISGICAAGVANAHDHMSKPAGPSIEVKVQQLDPVMVTKM